MRMPGACGGDDTVRACRAIAPRPGAQGARSHAFGKKSLPTHPQPASRIIGSPTVPITAGLSAAADAVLEAGELLDADRAARVQPAGGDADLGANRIRRRRRIASRRCAARWPNRPQNRTRAIDNLREFENNPQIYEALNNAGIDVEKWLMYSDQLTFTLGAEKVYFLAGRVIATPLTRLASETVIKLAEMFMYKQGFISLIPSDEVVSEEWDVRRTELVEKIAKLRTDIGATTDEKKRTGMEKGIAGLEKNLAAYKPARMRDTLHSMFDALTVQAKAISDVQARQETMLAKQGGRTREDVTALKQIDADIVKQITALIDRFEKTEQLIAKVGEQIKVSYDLFETKELFEHFREDADTIRKTLASFEKDTPDPLIGRQITVGICNRNPYSSLYIGNYTSCCVSIEGPIHGAESPIADYLTDLGMQIVVAVDTTNKEAAADCRCMELHRGRRKGKTGFAIDNIEANTGYTDRYKQQFTEEMKQYLEDYAKQLGVALIKGRIITTSLLLRLSTMTSFGKSTIATADTILRQN